MIEKLEYIVVSNWSKDHYTALARYTDGRFHPAACFEAEKSAVEDPGCPRRGLSRDQARRERQRWAAGGR